MSLISPFEVPLEQQSKLQLLKDSIDATPSALTELLDSLTALSREAAQQSMKRLTTLCRVMRMSGNQSNDPTVPVLILERIVEVRGFTTVSCIIGAMVSLV